MDRNKEIKHVQSLINSVLVTVKDLLTVEQLRKDFINVVGEEIPYKKFGFSTLLSFLESIPETISVIRKGNYIYVKPVVGKQLEHIVKLVHGQKTSKKPAGLRYPIRKPNMSHHHQLSSTQRSGASVYHHPNARYSQANRNRPNAAQMRWNVPSRPIRPARTCNTKSYGQNNNQSEWPTQVVRPNQFHHQQLPPRHLITQINPLSPFNSPILHPSPPLIKSPILTPSLPHIKSPILTPSPPPIVYNSAKEKLEAEAEKLKVSISKFITIKAGKKKPYWISKIIIDKTEYSTYPTEINTKEAAEEAAALAALKGLDEMADKVKRPVTKDFNLAQHRVADIVTNSGLWYNALQEKYKSKYDEILPDNFIQRCQNENIKELDFFSPDTLHWIVKKMSLTEYDKKAELNEISYHMHQMNLEKSQNIATAIIDDYDGMWPELELPKDKHWDVYVTYIKNCSSVSIRLIDKQYTLAYDNLLTNMELHYLDNENQISARNLVEGDFYACLVDGSWLRVCLEKVEGDSALVNVVDHGDDETVSLTKLYELKREFQLLPIQSLPCTLAGLDVGFEHEDILEELQQLALGKSLVAEVLAQDPDLSIVLYDTSTTEDININEKLLQILPSNFTKPQLPVVGGVCEAYIVHAEHNGDVFITLESETCKILESLMDNVKRKLKRESFNSDVIDVQKIYLSQCSLDEDWKRCVPRSANLQTNKVLMQFVDLGVSENLPSAEIIPLDAFSPLLCKIPHQAIKCKLSNVPSSKELEWTDLTVKRLLQLRPTGEPLLLKVIKDNEDFPSEVELFKRLQPQNELVSINATLAHDSALFQKKELRHLESKGRCFRKDEDPMPLPRVDLPIIHTYFDVHICYAASPQNFGVQNHNRKEIFVQLMEDIQSYYNKASNVVEMPVIKTGHLYVAQHTNHMWYRVKVDHCEDSVVTGLKVDCGDIFCTTSDKIQPLLHKFRNLPPQGYRASMGGVLPVNKDWTPEDCLRFRELVEGKDMVSVVLKVIAERESLPHLELKLIDTNGSNDVFLDQLFVKEGRAYKIDPSVKQ